MGNQIEKLKHKYEKGDYNVLNENQDRLLGNFLILSFFISKPIVCIKKSFNPKNYNTNIDVEYLIKLISKSHRGISDFFFMNIDKKNENSYTLIFEYGNILKKPIKEKKIWLLIENILEAMLFLEKNLLHYPILKLKYILEKKGESYKLLNPYVFPQFLEKVIKMYANPMVSISQKKNFHKIEIKRNVLELGILVLSLMGDFNTDKLYSDFNYRKNCLKLIFNNISEQLKEFFSFIFDERISPDNFESFKLWLDNNKKSFNPISMKDYYYFADNNNIIRNSINQQNRNFQNQNRNRVNTHRPRVNNNNRKVRASSNNVGPRRNLNFDNSISNQKKNQEFKKNSLQQNQRYQKNNNNLVSKSLIFDGEQNKGSNKKRTSINIFDKRFVNQSGGVELKKKKQNEIKNNDFFVGETEDVYNFINGGGQNTNNMNNYIKHQDNIPIHYLKNQNNNKPQNRNPLKNEFDNSKNKFNNFTNYNFKKNNTNQTQNIKNPNILQQNINQNIKNKNNLLNQNNNNILNQNKNNILPQNNKNILPQNNNILPQNNNKNILSQNNNKNILPQKNNNNLLKNNNSNNNNELNKKQVKSIIMRWDKESKKYKKTTYYMDGTSDSQIIENDIRLKKNEENLKNNLNLRNSLNLKKSLVNKNDTIFFVLEQDGKNILLFKRKTDEENLFGEMKKIVDVNKILMPSNYHQIPEIEKKKKVKVFDSKKKVTKNISKPIIKKKSSKKKLKKKDSNKKLKNKELKTNKKLKKKDSEKKLNKKKTVKKKDLKNKKTKKKVPPIKKK